MLIPYAIPSFRKIFTNMGLTKRKQVVNFASSRSVYGSTMELMNHPQIRTIAIIAEGVPERVS